MLFILTNKIFLQLKFILKKISATKIDSFCIFVLLFRYHINLGYYSFLALDKKVIFLFQIFLCSVLLLIDKYRWISSTH